MTRPTSRPSRYRYLRLFVVRLVPRLGPSMATPGFDLAHVAHLKHKLSYTNYRLVVERPISKICLVPDRLRRILFFA